MNKTVLKSVLAVAAVGVPLAVVAVVVGAGPDHGGAASQATPAEEATAGASAAARTVLVSRGRMPAVSQPGSPLHALRFSGPVPSRPSAATVVTDEDCSPDGEGVSHCLNQIRLVGGQTLTVRHPHRMMEVPCLSPGERVIVRPA